MINSDPIRQYILIRKDLKMRRGKEIAQGSHASMQFLAAKFKSSASASVSELQQMWFSSGMPKICLQVHSEDELVAAHEAALKLGVASFLVRDSGRTEFGGVPTLTSFALGPDRLSKIEPVTKELKLY